MMSYVEKWKHSTGKYSGSLSISGLKLPYFKQNSSGLLDKLSRYKPRSRN